MIWTLSGNGQNSENLDPWVSSEDVSASSVDDGMDGMRPVAS